MTANVAPPRDRSTKATRVVWLSVGAIVAIIVASSAASGASAPRMPSSDVELGPALMIFDTPSIGGDMDPLGDSDGAASSEGDDGKKKKKKGRPSGGDGTQDGDCWSWERSEFEFFEKVNDARARRDRPRLQLDPELSRVADYHSHNMARRQQLYHTPAAKLRERVTNWEILGENVGRGGSVESLHEAFMQSRDHREIVLYRPFNYVGVGVVEDRGVIWVTILFEAYDNPGTTMNMSSTC